MNSSWRLAPWADVLYAADLSWWRSECGVPGFQGLKISGGNGVVELFPSVRRVKLAKEHGYYSRAIQTEQLGVIGGGRNSGFQAFNLAIQFGSPRILLIAFDMRIDRGLHWHGDHKRGLRNPTARGVESWREVLDAQADHIAELGVEVINCSPISALKRFPKMSVNEALERWGV